MRTLTTAFIAVLALLSGAARAQGVAETSYAIVGGRVLPVEGPVLEEGVILTRGAKIEKIGHSDEVDIPSGAVIIDATGCVVTPGFVELHNHTAASDLQSRVYQVNPGSRVLDNLEFETDALRILALPTQPLRRHPARPQPWPSASRMT